MNIPEHPKLEDLNSNNCREKIMQMHYPEFYQYLIETYPQVPLFTEKLHWFYNRLKDFPKCACGNPVKFKNLRMGYYSSCSKNCPANKEHKVDAQRKTNKERYGVENAMHSAEKREKQKATNIARYGAENSFQSAIIKEKIRKINQERYGVDYPMQNEEFRKKAQATNLLKYGVKYTQQNAGLRNKTKATLMEHYGVDHNFKAKEVQQKIKETNLKKYGVENASQSIEIKNKVKETNLKKFGVEYSSQRWLKDKYPDIISIEGDEYICKCPHPNCNKCKEKQYKIKGDVYTNRIYHNSEPCIILCPFDSNHTKNTILENFVHDILDEYDIEYITNDRNILSGQELDVYIPSKHLAIECNGCYWHSTKHKSNTYHKNKWEKCKELNIQLINIWEDWIFNSPNIVKDMILSKLGIYVHRVGARQCTIREVSTEESRQFATENHIQGHSQASVKLGLYYEGELVSLMTFGKKRNITSPTDNKNVWELIRFCSKQGWQIIGGAMRLFKHFIAMYQPSNIISYSSNDISDGRLYKQLGFKYDHMSISYWYINAIKMIRYHRYNFTKQKLVQDGYDKNKSEFAIMEERGYMRIYDSGQTLWKMDLASIKDEI